MVEQAAVLDSIFHALSDATRRSILRDLSGAGPAAGLAAGLAAGKPVGELAKPFQMSLAAVSKHVQVLERAQLVERERRGQFQIVRLKPQRLRSAQEWLAFYETFWSDRLDSLQTYLEQGE